MMLDNRLTDLLCDMSLGWDRIEEAKMKNKLLPCLGLTMLLVGCWIAKAQSANGLPQAALDACSDKQSGDVCSFVNDAGDSINGSCAYQGGVNSKLICVPIH